MSWYYYSGVVVRPIPVKKGVSVSVRPATKIEIIEMTPEADALVRCGQLRIASRDHNAKNIRDVLEVTKKDMRLIIAQNSNTMLNVVAEKHKIVNGVAKEICSGVQFTEGELEFVKNDSNSVDVEKVDNENKKVDVEFNKDNNKKRKLRKKRH